MKKMSGKKRFMVCKKCGRQLADGAKFCGCCGASVEEPKEETGVKTEKKKKPIVSAAAVLCVILAGLAF